ncbi:MAG: hypothetical protein DRQ47_10005, partial [Gammaproteobacteria bacterium]
MRFPTLTKFQLIRTGAFVSRFGRITNRLKLFPSGTFGRIALMLAILLVINQVVSYIWVSLYIIKPQIDQTMYLIAPEVKMISQQLKGQ